MPQPRSSVFDDKLRRAGVPIDGISIGNPNDVPATVVIQYQTTATPEQIAWAEDQKLSFDWRPRRFLTDAQINAVITGLTAQQQNGLIRRLIILVLKANEVDVQQILADLNVSVPYEEVDA